jgi:phage terminase small subunit
MSSARKSAPAAKKAKAARKTTPAKKPAAKKAPAKRTPKKAPRSSAVEHAPDKGEVAGSTPAVGTTTQQPLDGHDKLVATEELFVSHYIGHMNATKAYMAVHPDAAYDSARVQACRLLAKPNIQHAIAEARAKVAGKLELSLERVLLEATRLALFDPRKLFAADGRPLNVTELDDDTAAAIAGLEVLEEYESVGGERTLVGHVKKYKVADKNSALEKLMKHLGAFEKDNRQKGASLADAFRAFLGQLHGEGGSRLTPVRREGAPGNALTPKGPAA